MENKEITSETIFGTRIKNILKQGDTGIDFDDDIKTIADKLKAQNITHVSDLRKLRGCGPINRIIIVKILRKYGIEISEEKKS